MHLRVVAIGILRGEPTPLDPTRRHSGTLLIHYCGQTRGLDVGVVLGEIKSARSLRRVARGNLTPRPSQIRT